LIELTRKGATRFSIVNTQVIHYKLFIADFRMYPLPRFDPMNLPRAAEVGSFESARSYRTESRSEASIHWASENAVPGRQGFAW